MLTFKYKDMRVRYQYMLALACMYLLQSVISVFTLNVRSTFELVLFAITYVPMVCVPLVFVFIASRALSYKVKFSDNEVILNNTRIEFAQIDRIKFDEEDLSYIVEYGYTKSRIVKMGRRESDEDIGTFRQAMRELISRVKLSSPNVKISHDTVNSVTPGTKIYENVNESIRAEKSKLAGIDGWLIYMFFDLMMVCISHISGIYLKHPAISHNWIIGILLYYLFIASIIVFALFALVFLVQKKKKFQKTFIGFLAYSLVAERIVLALQYTLIDGKWPGTVGIINGFVIGVIYNVVWLFAWRAYFQRSIRVKNTFL